MIRKFSVFLFFAAMVTVSAATALSPYFPTFISEVWRTGSVSPANREALRRSTPLWMGAVDIINTAVYLTGTSPNPAFAQVGKDGFIFLGDVFDREFSQAIKRRVLSDAEIAERIEIIRLQASYAKRRGVAYMMVTAPAKWDIYSDKLPSWAQEAAKRPGSLDKLVAAAKALDLPVLDVRPALHKASAMAPVYVATDSHWTDLGAWAAWTEIAREVERQRPDVRLTWYREIMGAERRSRDGEMRYMLNLRRPVDWTYPVLARPFPTYRIETSAGLSPPQDGRAQTNLLWLPRTTITEQAETSLSVLMLVDSTGEQMSSFYQSSFAHLRQYPHSIDVPSRQPNVPALFHAKKPDVMILMVTERYLNSPMGDLQFWRALDAFDRAEGDPIARWTPQATDRSGIAVGPEIGLSSPLPIKLPGTSQPRPQVVKLEVDAQGDGGLVLAYDLGKGSVSHYTPLNGGRNEVYLKLDEMPVGNVVWAYRNTQLAPASAVSVTVRYPGLRSNALRDLEGFSERQRDFANLKDALARYKATHGRYPVSTGWDGLLTRFGRATPNWIEGLAPAFINALPRDPRRSDNPDDQYLYRSDGEDYKLIVHDTGTCWLVVQVAPELRDAQRDCSAYGIASSSRSAQW